MGVRVWICFFIETFPDHSYANSKKENEGDLVIIVLYKALGIFTSKIAD
jgi:hypothetical protein